MNLSVLHRFLRPNCRIQLEFVRHKDCKPQKPRLRNPIWFTKQHLSPYRDDITRDNKEFIQQYVQEKYTSNSPLNLQELPKHEWQPGMQRTGMIAKKIGIYPLWLKTGKKITTTLLQFVDNQVVRSYQPGEYKAAQKKTVIRDPNRYATLIVGAQNTDPTRLTKEYCGLFKDSGVMPKSVIHRFFVSPEALLLPGTPLNVSHFRVGDSVDVRGKTIDRGFQGVMKRWGFHGMPATHGQTKTHRRPGNIGGGGEKGRVWPGTKLPGHMGNRWRILRGLTIWRINTKYNVMWVSGQNIPGDTNAFVFVYDTTLPLRKPTEAPPFPTHFAAEEGGGGAAEQLPEEIWHEELHNFSDPSVEFAVAE